MKLYILYGSQTLNAEELSHDLSRQASKHLIEVQLSSLDDILDILIDIKLAIFIVSTTGQGDPPHNMRQFWRGIMSKSLPKTFLSQLNFTVFGLGDSTYKDFNVVARKLFVRIKQLGGTSFMDKGLGDDIHDFGYEAEYHPWCERLWKSLEEFYPVLSQVQSLDGLLPSLYSVRIEDDKDLVMDDEGLLDRNSYCVQEVQKLSENFSTCYQITFEYSKFSPGDSLAIYPQNDAETVRNLMNRLGWTDCMVNISLNPHRPYDTTLKYPEKIQLFKLLTHYIDLHHPASRHFIEILAEYSEGLHQSKLKEMISRTSEGRNEYHRYITKEYRNICEVLYDFSSIVTIPLEYFLQGVRLIRPREFSIAGFHQLKILASLVRFRTPLMRTITGFCTGFLSQVKCGQKVFGNIVSGGFARPELNVPVIFVGTGTGIAPLWSIIEWRVNEGCHLNYLFFGTRHPDCDFYFKDEIEGLGLDGKCRSFVAFSQYQGKKYVQDLIKDQWEIVNSVLSNNGHILICGKSKTLTKSIKSSLQACLEHEMPPSSASQFISTLEKSNKIYAENW